MLKDMVDRFIADDYPFDARQNALRSVEGWSRETWSAIAGLGLLMVTVPEARGGMASSGVEAMLVGEAFGRGLVIEPWLASVIAAALLRGCEGDEADRLLDQLMSGEMLLSGIPDCVLTLASGAVSGSAAWLPAGTAANRLILPATDAEGTAHIVVVDPAGPGTALGSYNLAGHGKAARAEFAGAPAISVLASGDAAREAAGLAHAAGVAAIAADALGAAQYAFDMTVEHIKTRVQNGQPIGANQSLQHRAAEMFVELEQLRSAAILAACSIDLPDRPERDRIMAAVRVVTAKAARFIAQQAVQLHGGIGVTDEHAVGHCFLRLTADSMLLGDADTAAARLVRLGGFVSAAPYWEAE